MLQYRVDLTPNLKCLWDKGSAHAGIRISFFKLKTTFIYNYTKNIVVIMNSNESTNLFVFLIGRTPEILIDTTCYVTAGIV